MYDLYDCICTCVCICDPKCVYIYIYICISTCFDGDVFFSPFGKDHPSLPIASVYICNIFSARIMLLI